MSYIFKMLSQPSTYAGFSGIALAAGMAQPLYVAATTAAAAIFGLLAVILDAHPAPKVGG